MNNSPGPDSPRTAIGGEFAEDTREIATVRAFSLRTLTHSETGPVRKNNQDSGYASPTMIVVADGMGGAAAGDLASAVAITELARTDRLAGAHAAGEVMLEAMSGALSRANDRLADLVVWDHELEGMGTTVCGAMFSGSQLGLVHIGDSRGYLLREGKLLRLTHDHSWVQSLVDQGKLTEAEAAQHPHRSLLLKVLNGQPSHEPDLTLVDVQLGDRVMFCSDGLCGLVDDRDIRHMLRASDQADAMESLIAAAKQAGGYDNITVLIADVVDADPELDAEPPRIIGAAVSVQIPDITVGLRAGNNETDKQPNQWAGGDQAAAQTRLPDEVNLLPDGVIDPDANEEVRYTPTVQRRPRHLWLVAISLLAALALVVGLVVGVQRYAHTHFYLGPSNNQVGIYRGLPDQILGHPLGSLVEQRDTRLSDLPVWYANQVRAQSLTMGSLSDAQATADRLQTLAAACIAQRTARAHESSSPAETPSDNLTSTGELPASPADSSTASAAVPATVGPSASAGSTLLAPASPSALFTSSAHPAEREAC